MKIDNIADLPEDPLQMPPPYWRSSGAIFHIISSLEELTNFLEDLVPLNEKTAAQLEDYFSRNPPPEEDDPEFGEICNNLWDLEHKIHLKAEVAILMAAIASEDQLNMFCVFNLHKDIVEPLEKLSPPEKLQVVSTIAGHHGVKGRNVFRLLKRLTSYRNAFAHGHNVDRPTKTLRHNHLIEPMDSPGVPNFIVDVIELVGGYVQLCEYLASISQNPYTSGRSVELEEVKEYLEQISKYRFEGSNWVYEVHFEDNISEA